MNLSKLVMGFFLVGTAIAVSGCNDFNNVTVCGTISPGQAIATPGGASGTPNLTGTATLTLNYTLNGTPSVRTAYSLGSVGSPGGVQSNGYVCFGTTVVGYDESQSDFALNNLSFSYTSADGTFNNVPGNGTETSESINNGALNINASFVLNQSVSKLDPGGVIRYHLKKALRAMTFGLAFGDKSAKPSESDRRTADKSERPEGQSQDSRSATAANANI